MHGPGHVVRMVLKWQAILSSIDEDVQTHYDILNLISPVQESV